jgi:hypothetical protein
MDIAKKGKAIFRGLRIAIGKKGEGSDVTAREEEGHH